MGEAAISVFTDGACSGNPGPGGWAWAIEGGGRSCSGSEKASTNQRMEVWAVLDAVTTLLAETDGPIIVTSDSTYVVNCFRDRWYAGWESRGWLNSQKQPVANQDLWKPLIAAVKPELHRVSFLWVKGHSGNPMNDLVDQMAVEAAQTQSARRDSGATAPKATAPKATAPKATAPKAPAALVVTPPRAAKTKPDDDSLQLFDTDPLPRAAKPPVPGDTKDQFGRLLAFLRYLDDASISFTLDWIRRDSVAVLVVVPGRRFEIEFMEHGTVEVEEFASAGDGVYEVADGEALRQLLAAFED
jgi:ribonuclease HI